MDNHSGKLRTYFYSVLGVTLVAVILRTVSFLTDFDTVTGYFDNSNPINTVFTVLCILALLWILSVFFTFPKNVLPSENHGIGYTGSFGAVFAIVSSIAGLVLAATMFIEDTSKVLCLFGIFFFVCAIMYFLFVMMEKKVGALIHSLLGFGLILALLFVLATVYFDMKTAMNSPVKVMMQISILALMLFFLSEIRFFLARPLQRCYVAASLISVFFSLTSSLPDMIAFLCGKLDNMYYFIFDLVIFTYGIYALAKLYLYQTSIDKTPESSGQ